MLFVGGIRKYDLNSIGRNKLFIKNMFSFIGKLAEPRGFAPDIDLLVYIFYNRHSGTCKLRNGAQ